MQIAFRLNKNHVGQLIQAGVRKSSSGEVRVASFLRE